MICICFDEAFTTQPWQRRPSLFMLKFCKLRVSGPHIRHGFPQKPLAVKIPTHFVFVYTEMTPSDHFVPAITLPLIDDDVIKTQTFFNAFDWFDLILEAPPLTSPRTNSAASIIYQKTFREKTKQPGFLLSPALC